MLPQTALVNGADLLQQDHRVLGEAHAVGVDVDVGGELGLAHAGGDCGGNDRRVGICRE